MFCVDCPESADLPPATTAPPPTRRLGITALALLCGALFAACSNGTTQEEVTNTTTEAASAPATGLPTDPALPTTPVGEPTTHATDIDSPAVPSALSSLQCDTPRLTTAMANLTAGLPPRPELNASHNGVLACLWGEEDNQIEVRVAITTIEATPATVAEEVAQDPQLRRVITDNRFTAKAIPGYLTFSEENPDGAIQVCAYLPAGEETHQLRILAGGTTAMSGLPQDELLDAAWQLLTDTN